MRSTDSLRHDPIHGRNISTDQFDIRHPCCRHGHWRSRFGVCASITIWLVRPPKGPALLYLIVVCPIRRPLKTHINSLPERPMPTEATWHLIRCSTVLNLDMDNPDYQQLSRPLCPLNAGH